MRAALVGICLVMSVAGCSGGSGDGSITAPSSATATSIVITVRDVVLVGTSATAMATATLSDGQTQVVTNGWRSDAPPVATVTDTGSVKGVANGEATITVAFGGREGAKRIRVAPNYDGRWHGMQIVTACTATGAFADSCEEAGGVVGQPFPIGLIARQPGDLSVAGEFTVEDLPFPTFSTQVENDGRIRFSSITTFESVRAEVSWVMGSTEDGRSTGTIRERYSAPGIVAGELIYDSRISSLDRGGSAASGGISRSRMASITSRIQALRAR